MRILCVRDGLEDKAVEVTANGDVKKVRAIVRFWNWISVPLQLHASENEIKLAYGGELPLHVDRFSIRPDRTKD